MEDSRDEPGARCIGSRGCFCSLTGSFAVPIAWHRAGRRYILKELASLMICGSVVRVLVVIQVSIGDIGLVIGERPLRLVMTSRLLL